MTFTVHTGITKPAKKAVGTSKYPIADMQIGQVLHIPFGDTERSKVYRRAQSIRVAAGKRFPDRKYSTRAIVIAGVDGVGIWRDA